MPEKNHARGAVLLGLLALGPQAGAQGRPRQPFEALQARLGELESRLGDLEASVRRRSGESTSEDLAARRMTEAQVLYSTRNYEAAATILFDIVDRFQKSAIYPNALFYLGDALYQRREYLSAQRFLERLVDLTPPHARQQEALLRLVEISLHLGTHDQTARWLERLEKIPRDKLLPAVPYVRGKHYFLRQAYDRALPAFASIQKTSPYYFQARYFIGAIHVARGQLDEAIGDFQASLSQVPRTDEEKRIIELCHLALGRIYYEQGQNTRAHEEYLQISQKSDLFGDALYESAWVSIKAKEYKRAQRALELLVLAQPGALIAPEAKLLIGNLQIRNGEHRQATAWFQKTRDEFEPVHQGIEKLIAQHADTAAYFRDLIKKNLGRFDLGQVVPRGTERWIRAEKEVSRFSLLAGSVAELRRSLIEAEDTVARLEKALAGPQRYRLDGELALTREGAVRAAADILPLRRELAEAMLEAVTMAASAEERGRLMEMSRRRGEMEKDLSRVIMSLGSRSRAEQLKAQINEMDKRAAEMAVHIEGLRKQRQAIEKYYTQTKKTQKIDPQQFDRELSDVKAQEEAAAQDYERLRRDLAEALSQAGAESVQVDPAGDVQREYAAAVQAEQELMNVLRQRMSGAGRARADQIGQIFDRSYALESRLSALLGKVNQALEVKLAEVQASLLVEKENVRTYRAALDACSADTEQVGGDILAEGLRGTAHKFYDIMVRADVGVIDVAWALKQQRTERISRLVREQKRDLKLLDDEFREVLREKD